MEDRADQPDPVAGEKLALALPDDTFAQVCGSGGLVVEAHVGTAAALWRGHPWGTGWVGGGAVDELGELIQSFAPHEITVPDALGLPDGYRRGWGWGWHALRTAPPVQDGEDRVSWLDDDDPQLADLVTDAFPDAETPPGDPRVERWFGGHRNGQLVACGAELRLAPGAAVLSSLTVDPTVRRAGWGSALTAWFVRERLRSGTHVVGLGTYLGNTAGRALYDRLGFFDVPYLGAVREPGSPAAG